MGVGADSTFKARARTGRKYSMPRRRPLRSERFVRGRLPQPYLASRVLAAWQRGTGPHMVVRVLVVDDQPDHVEMYHLALEYAGFTVEDAFSGGEGLEQAR